MVGEPVELRIADLAWNEAIAEHLARHGVSHRNVMAVLYSNALTYTNLPDRGGSHVLIGPDDKGRILYISIRATADADVWQPVTGWESRFARRLWRQERGEG